FILIRRSAHHEAGPGCQSAQSRYLIIQFHRASRDVIGYDRATTSDAAAATAATAPPPHRPTAPRLRRLLFYHFQKAGSGLWGPSSLGRAPVQQEPTTIPTAEALSSQRTSAGGCLRRKSGQSERRLNVLRAAVYGQSQSAVFDAPPPSA